MPGGSLVKFITEIDLRNEFRKNPFETYYLNDSDRLTSEARQFLNDRHVTITREDQVTEVEENHSNSETETCQIGDVTRSKCPWEMRALVLYAEFLEVILLAKESQAHLCEELYSMSLVIKQVSVLDSVQEVQLNYAELPEGNRLDAITLAHLFSENGSLTVRLFKLEVAIRAFKEEFQNDLQAEQVEQLERIGSRLRVLMAQLIGE